MATPVGESESKKMMDKRKSGTVVMEISNDLVRNKFFRNMVYFKMPSKQL